MPTGLPKRYDTLRQLVANEAGVQMSSHDLYPSTDARAIDQRDPQGHTSRFMYGLKRMTSTISRVSVPWTPSITCSLDETRSIK